MPDPDEVGEYEASLDDWSVATTSEPYGEWENGELEYDEWANDEYTVPSYDYDDFDLPDYTYRPLPRGRVFPPFSSRVISQSPFPTSTTTTTTTTTHVDDHDHDVVLHDDDVHHRCADSEHRAVPDDDHDGRPVVDRRPLLDDDDHDDGTAVDDVDVHHHDGGAVVDHLHDDDHAATVHVTSRDGGRWPEPARRTLQR